MHDGAFQILLHHVEPAKLVVFKVKLAELFEIDHDIAESIANAFPIVLLDGLSFEAADIVRQRLQPLQRAGARFVTTDAPSDDVPKVNWPELPPVAQVQKELEKRQARELAARTAAPPAAGGCRCPKCGEALRLVAVTDAPARTASGRLAPLVPGAGLEGAPPPPPPVRTASGRVVPPPPPPPDGDELELELLPATSMSDSGHDSDDDGPAVDMFDGVEIGDLTESDFTRGGARRLARPQPVRPPSPPPAPRSRSAPRAEVVVDPAPRVVEPVAAPATPARATAPAPARTGPPAQARAKAAPVGATRPVPVDAPPPRSRRKAGSQRLTAATSSARLPTPQARTDPPTERSVRPRTGSGGFDLAAALELLEEVDELNEELSASQAETNRISATGVEVGGAALDDSEDDHLEPDEALEMLHQKRSPAQAKRSFKPRAPRKDRRQKLTLLDPNEAMAILKSKKGRPRRSAPSQDAAQRRSLLADPTQPIRQIPGPGRASGRLGSAAPPPPPGAEERRFGLVLGRLNTTEKREGAARLISDIKGIPYETALRLTSRSVVPVLNRVTRSEAEACLARFRQAQVEARITAG